MIWGRWARAGVVRDGEWLVWRDAGRGEPTPTPVFLRRSLEQIEKRGVAILKAQKSS